MSSVHAIINGSPVLVMIFSQCLIKGEKCSVNKALACASLVSGVAFVFGPAIMDEGIGNEEGKVRY